MGVSIWINQNFKWITKLSSYLGYLPDNQIIFIISGHMPLICVLCQYVGPCQYFSIIDPSSFKAAPQVERTSHSFNENQPMHRKRNFLKIFLSPNLTKITQCLYLTPFLISLKEVSFNFEWNGRNFNKLIKSSVKTEG